MTVLEWLLGETTFNWRVEVQKPWFGLEDCKCSLYVTWTFWIDDPIDAKSFLDHVNEGKGFIDGQPIS